MARPRRTVNGTIASNDDPIPASSSLADFDAEASLLALRKHVDAAANVAVDTDGTEGAGISVPDHLFASAAAAAATAIANSQLADHPGSTNGTLEPDSEAQIHPDLRSPHVPGQPLLPPSPSYPPVPAPAGMMSSATPIQAPPPPQPQVAPMQAALGDPGEAAIADGRKGPRRELSTSKRAAQNRAAQRAFRQRKEGYIKKLEQQVQDYAEMENQFKIIQSENYALREYIIHLQSKLLDAKGEMPQPPANLNLGLPGMPPGMGTSASTAAANLLANAAAAAAIQQQQQQQQQAAMAAAPQSAVPAPPKDDTPLARVAQAVAQLSGRSNDADKEHGAIGTGEAMDTSGEDSIDRKLQKLSEPVMSM